MRSSSPAACKCSQSEGKEVEPANIERIFKNCHKAREKVINFKGIREDPQGLTTARYLTPEERDWAIKRLESEVRCGVFNVQVWLTSTAYFAILSGLYSFGLFLPTIVNDLHIASTASQAQLWTVILYAAAAPVTVLVAFMSD
ncbi:hypothetical protein B0J13DRAFT_631248 [Dactylonectria estremocensis]|uniref:Major facilitator superfamily (MFS) profile domain-containing protein n=1 Tax=Dactylonectria estremocensis TaxID=1079267 RepID=A0A9P9D669_9HYPO|nr:hypothetical protein B0J13DRAFT_631248 [Dactylonectria estremocensis]